MPRDEIDTTKTQGSAVVEPVIYRKRRRSLQPIDTTMDQVLGESGLMPVEADPTVLQFEIPD